MPRVAAHAVSRIPERMELQTIGRDPDARTPGEQSCAVGRDQVREAPPLPEMPMQPEPATHRVHHTRAAVAELEPVELERDGILRGWQVARREGRVTHWQATTPS